MDENGKLQTLIPELLPSENTVVFSGELACLGPRFLVYNDHDHPGQNPMQFEMLEGRVPDEVAKHLERTMNGAEVTVTIKKCVDKG